MIIVEEKICNKLPGLTSLFINFPYKKEIVDIIKTFSPVCYDKKTFTWEMPLTYLSTFLDSVYLYDDIQIKLLEDAKQKEIEYKLTKYKTPPFPYQQQGIQYGLNHDKFLLLDSPGLGKSLQAIYLAQELQQKEKLQHCLIICGVNALKYNWKNEITKHSNLTCKILGEKTNKKGNVVIGSVQDRISDLSKKINEFFVVTNIETIRNTDIINKILKGPNKFDMLVVDEIHVCLSGDTQIETNLGFYRIDDIVNKKIQCKVKTKNQYGKIEHKEILDWHKNLNNKPLLKLTIQDENDVVHTIKCTPDHQIHTLNRGFVKAIDLTEFDNIDTAFTIDVHLSEEHKKKISDSCKGKHKGTICIHNDVQTKRIHPEELDLYINNGWNLGRYRKDYQPWNKGLNAKDDPRVTKMRRLSKTT